MAIILTEIAVFLTEIAIILTKTSKFLTERPFTPELTKKTLEKQSFFKGLPIFI